MTLPGTFLSSDGRIPRGTNRVSAVFCSNARSSMMSNPETSRRISRALK